MDWLSLVAEAIKIGAQAYKAGKIAAAEGERIKGAALLDRMKARYAESAADPGLPKGVQ